MKKARAVFVCRPLFTAISGILGFGCAATSLASTIAVTSCADDGSFGTLRAAILNANANLGADTITFSALFNSPQTISLGSALPSISDSVTITGPGAGILTVNQALTNRSDLLFLSRQGAGQDIAGVIETWRPTGVFGFSRRI